MTGTYVLPEAGEGDYWFDLGRFVSLPQDIDSGRPFRPAPFVTPERTFESLPSTSWRVLVDRRFRTPADLTVDDLVTAAAAARPGR